jgi:very-short-patch-repair endonuclease
MCYLAHRRWRQASRHARLGAHGIILLHFSPNQIRAEPATVVADLKAALAAGRARPRVPVRARPSAS